MKEKQDKKPSHKTKNKTKYDTSNIAFQAYPKNNPEISQKLF
jgi:hypothetical protein